jgi:hypothetical protein
MKHWCWAIAIVASAVTACASSNQSPVNGSATTALRMLASPFDPASPNMNAARAIAGCYTVAIGAWSDERAPSWRVAVPSRIQLDTTRNDGGRHGFELVAQTPDSGEGLGFKRRPAWSPVGTDSLQVLAWHNGTSDVNLFLRRRATGKLEGTARYFWDQIFLDPVTKRWLWERYPTAPASLTAVPCP